MRRLQWELSPSSSAAVLAAHTSVGLEVGNCASSFLDFKGYGKSLCKKWGVSPDAVVQLSYQIAYGAVHPGVRPGVYESCATRNFLRGRTEVIRSATPAAAAFVDAMGRGDQKKGEDGRAKARELFKTAAASHIELGKLAKKGMGVDRHFLAMRSVSPHLNHDFFDSDIFKRSKTWNLSTSNVSAPFLDRFGFGAVTGDGYGLGYLIHDNSVPVNVTAFKSSKVSDAGKMAKEIEKGLHDIKALF